MKTSVRLLFVGVMIALLAGYSALSFFNASARSFFSSYMHTSTDGVLFVGDVMLARSVEGRIQEVGGNRFFDGIMSLHAAPHFIVGNFEASVPDEHKRTPDFAFHFSVDPVLLPLLTKVGFTHMTLANNHANDFGVSARENTARQLEKNGITPFGNPDGVGTSSVTYLKENGRTIALVGMQTVTRKPILGDISTLMDSVRKNSDIQIAVIHWGIEYSLTHTPEQEEFAKFLVKEGFDAIIGHHPHVVEDVGSVQGVPVFYSLGNYVFDQYFDPTVETGLAVKISVSEKALTLRLIPVGTKRSVPYVMNDSDAAAYLRDLALRSDAHVSTGVSKGIFSVGY